MDLDALDMNTIPSLIERRQCARKPATEPVELYVPAESEELSGVLFDLSEQGAGLTIHLPANPLEPGELVTLTLPNNGRPVSCRARICWMREDATGTRIGVAFLKPRRFDLDHPLKLDEVRIDPDCILKIPPALALRRKVLPFAQLDGVVHVACAEPDCRSTVRVMERMFKAPVHTWHADPKVLEKVAKRVFGDGHQVRTVGQHRLNPLQNLDQDAVELSEEILYAAYLKRASDIHLDPTREGVRVRLRVDGQLEHYALLPTAVQAELIGRIKVLAGMDIAEKRAPQDGSFIKSFVSGAKPIDVRVATLPTKYGERVTLRLLALETDTLTLDRLGLSPEHLRAVERFLDRNQGMLLLSGPTGSGKTTTF